MENYMNSPNISVEWFERVHTLEHVLYGRKLSYRILKLFVVLSVIGSDPSLLLCRNTRIHSIHNKDTQEAPKLLHLSVTKCIKGASVIPKECQYQ